MNAKQISFEEACILSQKDAADFYPFGLLSEKGRASVKVFADTFYGSNSYNEDAVFNEASKNDTDLLSGGRHNVEFRRVNKGIFGGFITAELSLNADEFDWFINT